MPDHAGVRPRAGEAEQGVHQQGLAGTGLAGDDRQAALERQFGRADDGEILDGQVFEHECGNFA